MSRQIQIRRGTAAEHENFTGAIGEITMDTTNKTLRVHDGETAGGTILAKQSDVPAQYVIPENYDFVVECQLPTAQNNYTWYRKYKSGWVEQGGRVQLNGQISSTNKRVTFPVEMSDALYFSLASQDANSPYTSFVGWQGTTGMSVGTNGASTTGTVRCKTANAPQRP